MTKNTLPQPTILLNNFINLQIENAVYMLTSNQLLSQSFCLTEKAMKNAIRFSKRERKESEVGRHSPTKHS